MHRSRRGLLAVAATIALAGVAGVPGASARGHGDDAPVVRQLVSFAAPGCTFGCGSGSTVGPDGALYVTDGAGGRVLRVDPRNGATSVFATGLPTTLDYIGIGGAMDVAFLGRTAYVLVALTGPPFGVPDQVDGIYRVQTDGSLTVVADIGHWSIDHPPVPAFFLPNGVQYAMQPYKGGFLVTDGHHNRVLRVGLDGSIGEVVTFDDVVPTGLEVADGHVYICQAGPIPHLPENGKVLSVDVRSASARTVASGASLLVDVERGPHGLYALSQGFWDLPNIPDNEGFPASANTGQIVKVTSSGNLAPIVGGLDRPTSFEFIGNSAFVVGLTGTITRVDHIAPHG